MGGSSSAKCKVVPEGLLLEGRVIEEGGGFVSCRSPILMSPLNLSSYRGLRICVDGQGKTLKLALASRDRLLGISQFISDGLRWVAELETMSTGTTTIDIPFRSFQPAIRAKPLPVSIPLDPSRIRQIQLLYSKFGQPGHINEGFKSGPIRILLRSISAFF